MSHSFSFKTFFRSVSPDHLKIYFERHSLLAGFDWSLESEALAEGLYSQIEQLPDSHAATIEQDFVTISELANEQGILEILDVAGTLLEDADSVIDQMMQQQGFLNQVFWMSLAHPDVFDWAIRLERMEHMTFKEDCLVGRGLTCATDDETVEKLKEHIQKFYKKQRRGRNCQIDAYVKHEPTRYCFFAYPEDYPRRDLTYKSSKLVPQVRRPVLEIVFVYEPHSGILKVHASRMRRIEVMQEAFCKAVLGLPGVPDTSTRVYNLSRLLDPTFRFSVDPQDRVEMVTLRMVKILLNKNSRIACEGNLKDGGADHVRSMIIKALTACGGNPNTVEVLSAKITMQFAATDGGRKKSVTFTVSTPSSTNLEDKPHHLVARKYMEKWGFVRALLSEDEAA